MLLVKQKENNKEFYQWMYITPKNTEPALITRYLHSATMFGPYLFVIGGKSSHSNNAIFDVFSFISNSWYRFHTVGLFRPTIWVYFNDSKCEEI